MCGSAFDRTAKWWSPSVMVAEKTGNEKLKGKILDPLNGLGTGYGYQDRADYKKSWADYNAQMAGSQQTYLTGGTGEGEIVRRRPMSNSYTMLGG